MNTIGVILTQDESNMQSMVANTPLACFPMLDKTLIEYVYDNLLPHVSQIICVASSQKIIEKLHLQCDYILETADWQKQLLEKGNDETDFLFVHVSQPLWKQQTIQKMLQSHQKCTVLFTKDNAYAGMRVINKKMLENNSFLTLSHYQTLILEDDDEALSIQNRILLAKATQIMQERINTCHMNRGVSIIDPRNTYIGKQVKIGNDSIIHPNTFLYGNTIIGTNCKLGPNLYVEDSIISNDISIKNAEIKDKIMK